MKRLNIDIETYSDKDLSKVGVYKYSSSPNFEVLILGYAVDGGDVRVIDLAQGEPIPDEFMEGLMDENVLKWAFNAQFERVCLGRLVGENLDPKSWRCTMVASLYLGLPASLAAVGEIFKFEKQKLETGKDLIKMFSVPHSPTKTNPMTRIYPKDQPEKWKDFLTYNERDVVTEMEIYDKVMTFPVPDFVWQQYALDQRINDTGICVDDVLVRNAIACDELFHNKYLSRAQELTGLLNPNSPLQLKNYLNNQGVNVESLSKGEVSTLLETTSGDAKEVLELRQLLSKSSVKKYVAMDNCLCDDGRAHGLFQYYGTHTGRWSGRLIQLQNLPQNHIPDLQVARDLLRCGNYDALDLLYDSVPDTLSQLIRTAFVPEAGKHFVVCDYHSIECIVGAWVSREAWKVKAYNEDKDLYCATAEKMFGKKVEKHGKNSELRKYGKLMELAGAYGGGVNAMKAFGAVQMGLEEDKMQEMVKMWRDANPQIEKTWWAVDNAVIEAVKNKKIVKVNSLTFYTRAGILFVKLPSGRELVYQKPRIEINDFGREGLVYEGLNMSKKWVPIATRGARVYENCIQAISRDILADALMRLHDRGYKIVMHVHDETVIEANLDVTVEDIRLVMEEPPRWAPDLHVRADGYICSFYKKD